MKKTIAAAFFTCFLTTLLCCNSGNTPGNDQPAHDSLSIAAGAVVFTKQCSGCHNFRQDGIGPQLGGITASVSTAWIRQFIKDPKKMVASNDAHAKALFAKYKVLMPSFASLKEEEVNHVIAYLGIHQQPAKPVAEKGFITNPLPDAIPKSNLLVQIREIAQFPPSDDSGKLPLARITKLDYQPGTGQLFVVDLRGKLYRMNQNKPEVYMDMAKLRPAFVHEGGLAMGFGSFAFHPQFLKNGLFYTTHTERPGTAQADFRYADSIKAEAQWVLTEWKADNPAGATFSGKGRELLRVNMVSTIHGVQEISFNPLAKPGDEDYGLLYVGVGDGGCVENGYPFLAHSKGKIWGSIIRIDPSGRNSTNGHYGIPPQNPFVNSAGQGWLGEIYAYGFRNPHRITWNTSGAVLVSNVGQANIESINLLQKGHDYGWPVREGSFLLNPYGDLTKVYPLPANDSSFHITYPVVAFDHDEGKAISGGYEYEGTTIPQLKGKYLFGDIPSGRLFYVDVSAIGSGRLAPIKEWQASLNGKPVKLSAVCGSDRVDVHFGRDARGELYLFTKADGRLYKLISAGMK